MDGEIDGCVGEEDARIDRQMHRWSTGTRSLPSRPRHARGAEPPRRTGAHPRGSSHSGMVARTPPGQRGGRGGSQCPPPSGFLPTQPPPGRAAPPDPTVSAHGLAGDADTGFCPVARSAWLKATPKQPGGLFRGMAARPCVPPSEVFASPRYPPHPPALRPGSCTGAQSCKFTAFQLQPKNKRFGKYLANEWEDEKRRN